MLRRFVVAAGSALAATLVLTGTAAAQTGVLAGAVFAGESRTGLEGATVTIVGTTLTAVTGKDGRFVIANVPAGDLELRIRRTEFSSREDRVRVAAGDTTHAYYELLTPEAERSANRITLRSPRVVVSGGADTSAIGFTVSDLQVERKPLIIIDGVILSDGSSFMKEMDPSRIESVEVLKGEAARDRYGSRAGDGVIMIRTKGAPIPPPPPTPPGR